MVDDAVVSVSSSVVNGEWFCEQMVWPNFGGLEDRQFWSGKCDEGRKEKRESVSGTGLLYLRLYGDEV